MLAYLTRLGSIFGTTKSSPEPDVSPLRPQDEPIVSVPLKGTPILVPPATGGALQQRARSFAGAAPKFDERDPLGLLESPASRGAALAENMQGFLAANGQHKRALALLNRVEGLQSNAVIARLLTHSLIAEILTSRARFATIDEVMAVLQKRHGELRIGFFDKIKLVAALAPFTGELELLKSLSRHYGQLSGMSEGAAALELLSALFGTGHATATHQLAVSRFLALLRQA